MSEENRIAEPEDTWDDEDRAWLLALTCAANPVDVAPEVHDHLVAEALAFAPTAEELVAARAFRDELDAGTGDAAFLQEALKAALNASPMEATKDVAAGVDAALGKRRAKVLLFRPRTALPAAAVLVAMAAAVLLYLKFDFQHMHPEIAGNLQASLVPARSTQELFDQPFERPNVLDRGSKSVARIDRIAAARDSDYRHNRFARWGVK